MATTRSSPASTPSRIASAAKGGGTKTALAVAPVSRTASATVSKIGTRVPRVQTPGRPCPGDTGDDLRAVVDGELGVAATERAGDAPTRTLVLGVTRMDIVEKENQGWDAANSVVTGIALVDAEDVPIGIVDERHAADGSGEGDRS